jgi:hypothetical protein
LGAERNRRHSAKGLSPRARQVPKMVASVILVAVPAGARVPPLILRATTGGRRLRSAPLLVAGTSGWPTNTNSSLRACTTMLWQNPGGGRRDL